MINYSEPRFISVEDILTMPNVDKNKTIALCKCPLPLCVEIDGVIGGYYHIIEREKTYVCKDCGTEFSVGGHNGK